MNYAQSSYTELNDRCQMRIFDQISASALGRREPFWDIGSLDQTTVQVTKSRDPIGTSASKHGFTNTFASCNFEGVRFGFSER